MSTIFVVLQVVAPALVGLYSFVAGASTVIKLGSPHLVLTTYTFPGWFSTLFGLVLLAGILLGFREPPEVELPPS